MEEQRKIRMRQRLRDELYRIENNLGKRSNEGDAARHAEEEARKKKKREEVLVYFNQLNLSL